MLSLDKELEKAQEFISMLEPKDKEFVKGKMDMLIGAIKEGKAIDITQTVKDIKTYASNK